MLSFNESNAELASVASSELSDAAVALATHGCVIHIVMGTGVKDYVYKSGKIVAVSSFEHDVQVSTTEEQTAVATSEDGSTLVVASDNGSVAVLRLEHVEPVFTGPIHTNGITDLSITSNGSLVGTTGRDKLAQIWRSKDGEVLQTLDTVMPRSIRTHIRAIRFCSAQPDVLFTAESNPRRGGWIAAWQKSSASEIARYTPIAKIKASSDALTALCVNNDGSLLATSSAEGHVSLFAWDGLAFSKRWSTETRTNPFKASKPPHVLPVTGMYFSTSDKYVLAASADYTISIWKTRQSMRWRRCTRALFWLFTILIALFAILMAEDQHLNEMVRIRRAQMAPFMEPHLSKVQKIVRPFVRERHTSMHLCFSRLRNTAQGYMRETSRRIPAVLVTIPQTLSSQRVGSSDGIVETAKATFRDPGDDFPQATCSSSGVVTEGSQQTQPSVSPGETTAAGDRFGHSSVEAIASDASAAMCSLDTSCPTEFRNELLAPLNAQNND